MTGIKTEDVVAWLLLDLRGTANLYKPDERNSVGNLLNRAANTIERLRGENASASGVAVAAQRFCSELCEDSPDVPQPELKALHEALDAWEATR